MRIVLIGGMNDGHMVLKYLLDHDENVVGVPVLDPAYAHTVAGYVPLEPLAEVKGIPCFRVKHINHHAEDIRSLRPDIGFVVGWSQLVSKEILEIPKCGCIGFHSSLLPKRRGRSPIVWAIADGLTETGVTMFYLTERVDDGDVIAQARFRIEPEDTAFEVLAKADKATLDLLRENIPLLKKGAAPRIPQNHDEATYTRKRGENDQVIDWERPVADIYNLVRALSPPYPGAFTFYRGKKLFIRQAGRPREITGSGTEQKPGVVTGIDGDGFYVSAGNGDLLVRRVQIEEDTEMAAAHFARQYHFKRGARLGPEEDT